MPYSASNPDSTMDYSTRQISNKLVQEVLDALKNIRGWGSVEIQVQDYKVVQITERNIKKTISFSEESNRKPSGKQTVRIGS